MNGVLHGCMIKRSQSVTMEDKGLDGLQLRAGKVEETSHYFYD